MNPQHKRTILQKLGLTLWALATLILCFVVILLVNEMIRRGANPLQAFQAEPESFPEQVAASRAPAGSLGTRSIALYFVSPDGQWLTPDNRVIEYGRRTVENCRKALNSMSEGPKQEGLLSVIPAHMQLRALYLLPTGELIVDLSSEMLLSGRHQFSLEMESLLFYGIINTLTQPELQGENDVAVQSVSFLFDGVPARAELPFHFDLTRPLVQDKRWIQVAAS